MTKTPVIPTQESLLLQFVNQARALNNQVPRTASMYLHQSISVPTAEITRGRATQDQNPNETGKNISNVIIDAFIDESFCMPFEAVQSVKIVGLKNYDVFVQPDACASLLHESSASEVNGFLAAFLTAVSFRLTDNRYYPEAVFRAIARSVVPFEAADQTMILDLPLHQVRFPEQTTTVNFLLSNPLALSMLILRMNLINLTPYISILGEYNSAVDAASATAA